MLRQARFYLLSSPAKYHARACYQSFTYHFVRTLSPFLLALLPSPFN